MDLLADLLDAAGVHGAAGARVEAGSDWGSWMAAGPAGVHAVAEGQAWLRIGERPPVRLVRGDLVLMPRGIDHVFASDPAAAHRTTATRTSPIDERAPGDVRIGTAPFDTRVLCAHYRFDGTASRPLLDGLPDVLVVRTGPAPAASDDAAAAGVVIVAGDPDLRDVVALLGRELAERRDGSAVVLDRLVDVLLVEVVRAWLAATPDRLTGSDLCALKDPLVGAAVAAIHADPALPWTTESLAAELHVSRATLARRFPAAIGETPGAYLTRRRMDVAAQRLRDTDEDLRRVARDVGYTSAPAFNRAFRRLRGTSPGRFRADARAVAA